MITLTTSKRGQVTLPEEILQHLGVKPGGKIEVDRLPNGGIVLRAARTGTIDDFIGILAGKTHIVLTIEEINEAARAGWAGEVSLSD